MTFCERNLIHTWIILVTAKHAWSKFPWQERRQLTDSPGRTRLIGLLGELLILRLRLPPGRRGLARHRRVKHAHGIRAVLQRELRRRHRLPVQSPTFSVQTLEPEVCCVHLVGLGQVSEVRHCLLAQGGLGFSFERLWLSVYFWFKFHSLESSFFFGSGGTWPSLWS